MKKTILLSLITSTFLLSITGCGVVSEYSQNKDFKELAKESVVDKKDEVIKNNIKEIIIEKQFLDLSYDKRLSVVLKELGLLEGRSYFLKTSDINDITVPAIGNKKNIRIDNFDKLNQYIKDVSNYGLFVVKNEFLVNQAKVVEVRDLRSLKSDFSKVGVNINSNKNLKDVLSIISDISKFNIVFSKDFTITNKDDIYINYKGENLQGLLEYVAQTLDVYVDVDYDRKMIKFNKYKKKYFDLIISDYNINGTTDNETVTASTTTSTTGSSSKSSSLTNTVTITLYTHLTENLNKLFETGKTENPQNFYTLNKTTGQVMVNGTKEVMKAAEEMIDQFNNSFNSQVKINLEIYEVLVKNTRSLGADYNLDFKDGKNTINSTATNAVADKFFSMSRDGKIPFDLYLSSLNTIGKVVNNNTYFLITRNHMPYNKKIVTSTNYVKSVTSTTTTTTTNPVTQSSQETDVINEGFTITILPNIVGENISLNVSPNITQLISMDTETYSDNKITLPKVSSENFTNEVMIKDGEKIIIGSVTTYAKSEDYKGVIPLEDFIIGGNSAGDFLRKETVFVISADIVKK